MFKFNDDRSVLRRLHSRVGIFVFVLLWAMAGCVSAAAWAEGSGASYWLKYGKPPRLCSAARTDTPAKIEGASWGIIASGIILCRDLGSSYAIKLEFLNVRIDPADRTLLKRSIVNFDWFGLALYRPDASDEVEWLFDTSWPIKGALQKDSSGRVVFGDLSFVVPKQQVDGATNMLFYLTFDGPVVAMHVL